MKSISSVALLATVAVLGGSVESFAPPSLSSQKVVDVHVHKTSTTTSRQQLSTTFSTTTSLFTLNNDNDSNPDNTPKVRPSTISRRKQILRTIHQKSKPITLAILTTTATQFLPGLSNVLNTVVQPASASAPIVLRANKKKDDPPMIQAEKKAEELKKAKSLEEFDIFMAKANDIEISDGKAARNAYEKQYQLDKAAKEVQLQKDVIKLKQTLLDEGQDPYTDLDAERQVWLLEHNLDLEKVSGTPQNEQMIRTKLSRNKKKNAVPTYEKQRYIIKCQVQDLKARGLNPLTHFAQPSVQEKTRAIYKMDDKVATKVAMQYEELMTKYNGRLTEPQDNEGMPFTWDNDSDVLADELVDGKKVIAVGGSDKAKRREERAASKAKRAAERESAKAARAEERAAAKAQRAEAKAVAKAEREAVKEAKLAEKVAAAAGVTAAVGTSVAGTAVSSAASSMVDGEIAATANGDISATAGTNAVSSDLVETASTAKSTSSSDLLTKVKNVATKRNVGTVVIGGSAALYGINYYKENNSATVSSREEQLRLILGDDDDEDDDDDFDDDDEDDDFAKFTQKKKKKRTPPEDDELPSKPAPKVSMPPPTPPPPPVPAPKPRVRKLGIFSKRNANARETDLNVLISSDAKAPQFATLLSQILTFGAPGRFPAIAAWSAPMPFDKFDLEEAKSLLFSTRKDAELTDEESAEIFASVVNCMIIDIVDLASIALKAKDKDEKVTVDAINVVMDFMDHAASLFDAVAEDVTIKPVTYGGNLRKKDLEQMFSVYAGSSMMSLDALAGGGGSSQDRVDTLQLVFAITDKKAEGLMQKHMMKQMMNLMKDGGKGLEGMMGGEGMEGMEEMMAAMGGADGSMPGMPGMPGMDGEMSPEDLEQTLGMMKDLMESGQVSEDELVEVRKQFKEMYGSDIGDLIKKAGDEAGSMTEDEAELLDMFKTILGE